MKPFAALIARDLRLAARSGGDVLTLILFFISVGVLMPFAIGPDRPLLQTLAPGIIWIAALLASLLGLDRIFRADAEDGSLLAFRHADLPLEALSFAKLVSAWLLTAAPLIIATPFLALMFDLEPSRLLRTVFSLLAGTPALTAFGVFGAALTVSLKHGTLIAPVLVLPFSMPVLIFGISSLTADTSPGAATSALLFLGAISLLATAFLPFAAALALRLGAE